MFKKPVIGIMAATKEGVIGRGGDGNGLPWDYPEELEIYRKTTAGAIVIMGRKTFECLPEQACKNRTPIVLSRTLSANAFIEVARSPEESLTKAFAIAGKQPIFMIGGAETAHSFLKSGWIDTFLFTSIHHPHQGDVSMDLKLLEDWRGKTIHKTADFTLWALDRPMAKQPRVKMTSRGISLRL